MDAFLSQWGWALGLAVAVLLVLTCYKLIFRLFGVVIIPQDSVGVVDKKFVLVGQNKTLPDGCIIALHGEAGIQADTLAPGIYFGYWPWQYKVRVEKFVTIPEDNVGVVESRDGKSLTFGRVLAKRWTAIPFRILASF